MLSHAGLALIARAAYCRRGKDISGDPPRMNATGRLTTRRTCLLMATDHPTSDRRAVPLDLPVDHIAILRDDLSDWLDGARLDLEAPEKLKDPDGSRRVAAAYERLLAGLERGEILIPDEEAQAAIEAAAKGSDAASDYAEIVATHDAHHGLLALLGGASS